LGFLKKIASDTYAFEQARGTLETPTHDEYNFPANPYPQDPFVDSYDPSYSCMPPIFCDYCDSSNHDTCHCLYHDYVGATCASVEKKINELTDKMVETMKGRIT